MRNAAETHNNNHAHTSEPRASGDARALAPDFQDQMDQVDLLADDDPGKALIVEFNADLNAAHFSLSNLVASVYAQEHGLQTADNIHAPEKGKGESVGDPREALRESLPEFEEAFRDFAARYAAVRDQVSPQARIVLDRKIGWVEEGLQRGAQMIAQEQVQSGQERPVDDGGDDEETGEESKPDARKFEPTSEAKIRSEIRFKALEESRRHFDERAREMEEIFTEREYGIRELLHRLATGEPLREEDVYTALGLDPRVDEDRDIATVVHEGLKKCLPVIESGSAFEMLRKYVIDIMSPARNVDEQQRAFDAEQDDFFRGEQRDWKCWYFTPKGQPAVRRIESEIRMRYKSADFVREAIG